MVNRSISTFNGYLRILIFNFKIKNSGDTGVIVQGLLGFTGNGSHNQINNPACGRQALILTPKQV